jgi:short-subunit dehydrogenase
MKTEDKTVAITGVAHGLGRELAVEFAKRHNSIILVDSDFQGLENLQRSLGRAKIKSYHFDLSQANQRQELIDQILFDTPVIHILINCAGLGSHSNIWQLSIAEIEKLININTIAPIELIVGLLPIIPKDTPAFIVNIGSIAGELNPPSMSIYAASKSALHSFSKSIEPEIRDTEIKILLVILGALSNRHFEESIKNHITGQPNWYQKFKPEPSKVASKIIRAIEKDKTRLVFPPYYGPVISFASFFPFITDHIKTKNYNKITNRKS